MISGLPSKKQDELVTKGKAKVQEAAKKIRESKSKVAKSAGAQIARPAVPAVAPENPPDQTEPQQEASPIEQDTPEPKANVAHKEHPLLRKLHESLDRMVTAALLADKMDRLDYPLQHLIGYVDRFKAKIEESTLV